MSRRDTIIIAVLLNAALLVVLFMTAVQNEPGPHIVQVKERVPQKEAEKQVVAAPKVPQGGDTIDDVLNKYSEVLSQKTAEKPKVQEKKQTLVQKQPEAPKPKKLPHEESVKTITVVKGDMLEKIARSHGVSVESIMKENNMQSTNLRIGQKLKIPRSKKHIAKAKAEKKVSGKFYVVKGGDNPWSIAKKNNIQVEDLLRLNNMDEAKAKRLRPGDRLRIE